MQIFWHGYSSVRIESKNGDTECTLITDPFENEASIRFPRTTEPDVLVLSNQSKKEFNLEPIGGTPFVISDPGEFEVRGVFILGIQDPAAEEGKERPLIYRIVSEGMNIAFLGRTNRKPTAFETEQLGNVDILIVPVGGGDVLEPKQAAELITLLEPRLIVPLYFALPGLKKQMASVDQFVKAVGACERENLPKAKFQRKDLPEDTCKVMVLDRS